MILLPQELHFSEEKKYPSSTAPGNIAIKTKRNGNKRPPISANGNESCLLDI